MSPRRRRTESGEPEQVLFLPDPPSPGGVAVLTGSEADHARRSLRIRPGDPMVMVDGGGTRYRGHVTGLDKHEVRVRVEKAEAVPAWPEREIWLGAGVLRSTRMDFLIEKASELGVSRVAPLVLERSVARPHEDGAKAERWRRLAVESLKQSRRGFLMEVVAPQTLEEFLDGAPAGSPVWAAEPGGRSPAESGQIPPQGPLILVVGPEGGLSETETRVLRAREARLVSLGGNRLRAETAALTLVVAALGALGALRGPQGRLDPGDPPLYD